MTCNDIHSLLPAYLDGALSPEERQRVEEHLRTCPGCRQETADLEKTVALLRNIEEVEPPPFYEQRIMAAIREEAEQKRGIFRRFFFPLHIKVPMQALATIIIAVFAFYVYQQSDPEVMQPVRPPVPVTESAGSRTTADVPKAPAVPSPAGPDKGKPAEPAPPEPRPSFAPPPPAGAMKQESIALSKAPPAEERLPAPSMPARDADVAGRVREQVLKKDADRAADTLSPEQTRKSKMTASGAREMKEMQAAPAPARSLDSAATAQPQLDVTLQVRDAMSGLREVEACLDRFSARIMEKRQRGDAVYVTAEIDSRDGAAFMERLKGIGLLIMEKGRLEVPSGKMRVSIRIESLP